MKSIAKIFILLIFLLFLLFIFKNQSSIHVNQLKNISNVIPVVIIGSGPAGLSAALYTSRAGFETLVISGDQLGGTLMDVKFIENWPGRKKTTGMQAIEELQEQAKRFGTQVTIDTVNKVDFSMWPYKIFTDNEKELNALSVIIATGGTQKRLNIPGVDQYWGHGVGLCSLCEAPFNKDQDVAVIGGGDTAAERALQLAAYAKKVYVIVRDPQLDANTTVQGYLRSNKNIEIKTNTELQKILGNGSTVTGMRLADKETGAIFEIPINSIYFSIGYRPNSKLFANYLKLDERGFIATNGHNQTTDLPGVFVAGNVAQSDTDYGKAGVAIGSGVKAGIDTIKFLETIGLTPQKIKELEPQFYRIENEELPKITVPVVQ